MRRLLAALLLATLPTAALAWTKPKAEELKTDEVKAVRYWGQTDEDMLKQVRSDVEDATRKDSKVKVLRVAITSPGGPVITSLEIARVLRAASDKGLVVEVHAEALCASGCTFVLASGTPGHRYISTWALFLVHGPQASGDCQAHVDQPKTERDKIVNALLDLLRDAYVRLTGKPAAEVEDWLSCGQERVGRGDLAVSLGIADKVE